MDTAITPDLNPVAKELGIPLGQVQSTVELLDEGNTVPFITRYRKDQTGALDEERIRDIQKHVDQLRALAARKQKILRSIESQDKLTPELAENIRLANSAKWLEDLYLPYKPKKQTLATKARERGLDPLAQQVLDASSDAQTLEHYAEAYVDNDKQLPSTAEVLEGVGYLLAERFSERLDVRQRLRRIIRRTGMLVSLRIESPTPESKLLPDRIRSKKTVPTPQEKLAGDTSKESAPTEAPVDESTKHGSNDLATTTEDAKVAKATAADTASTVSQGMASEARKDDDCGADPVEEIAAEIPCVDGKVTANDACESADVAGEQESGPPANDSSVEPATEVLAPRAERSLLRTKKKDQKRKKLEAAFKDYFKFREPIHRMPPHRILAINRGERAGMLRVRIEADGEALRQEAENVLVPENHPYVDFLLSCVRDALVRLILPSLEREARRELTERAEAHATKVFVRNLRNLLLQPPVSGRRVLAADPGFRSGCKLAALDEFGGILGHGIAYVVGNVERRKEARAKIIEMITEHESTVVAIGNGTACRQIETLVAEVIADELAERNVEYTVVNEAGASVYSTSPLGREEMPDLDATQRSAVSIGRRLLDPLSELVKINPANIGVGLYQHDVKVKHLRSSLDAVVESCVNAVGVDVNTASPALLSYVSGLNKLTARRIYDHRREHGPFNSREAFKEVPGFGEAAFVQAAGFLKIIGGANPLDATWIHPESYAVAKRILDRMGSSTENFATKISPQGEPSADQSESSVDPSENVPVNLDGFVENLSTSELSADLRIGELTLQDILNSLTRPRRDPREDLPPPIFRRGVVKLDDLEPGMELAGTVLNVVDFGVFVDIGLHDSGLIHVSRLANRYISDPHEIVSVGDVVNVWVVEVDKGRRRVSLTAIGPGTERPPPREKKRDGPRKRYKKPAKSQPWKKHSGAEKRPKRRPQKPAVPITKAMEEGREPMRTFGDLKQFYEKKTDSDEGESGDKQ